MTKRIDGKMPSLIGRLPRLPYTHQGNPGRDRGRRRRPLITIRAARRRASPAPISSIPRKLDQRPLWEIPALTVHEAVPGHHHQIALQQELDMPEWRKNTHLLHRLRRGLGALFGAARDRDGAVRHAAERHGAAGL